MPNHVNNVVLSEVDGVYFERWARQYVNAFVKWKGSPIRVGGQFQRSVDVDFRPAPRKLILTGPAAKFANKNAVARMYEDALKVTRPGGRLIVSLGHGAASGGADGNIDLAPGKQFQICGLNNKVGPGNHHISVFYDMDIDGSGPRISNLKNDSLSKKVSFSEKMWPTYARISKAFRASRIDEVVFLTCKVGSSRDFLRKIAADWQVKIRAFKVKVQASPDLTNRGTTRIHFQGEPKGTGANIELSDTSLYPVESSSHAVIIGPTLNR